MTTCLQTDGNSYVQVTNANFMEFGTGNFVLEAWILPTSAGAIISNKVTDSGFDGYLFTVGADGSLHIAVDNGLAFYAVDSNPQWIMDGNWHHVAAVRTQYLLSLYLDGNALQCTTRSSGDPTTMNLVNSAQPTISARPASDGTDTMSGSFAEVRAWGVSVSQGELQNNMYQRLTVQEGTAGLIALWPLADGTPTEETGQYPSGNIGNCQYPPANCPIDNPPPAG